MAFAQLKEIPQIAVQILEHRNRPVRLFFGLTNEPDSIRYHAGVVPPEIVSVQEERDAPSSLISDIWLLLWGRGPSEKHVRACRARRSHDDPPFVLLRDRNILNQDEMQLVAEERDRFVIVPNDEGNVNDRLLQFRVAGRTSGETGV